MAEDTLFGFPIPFPKYDLFVAATAVALYIPTVITVNYIVNRVMDLFSSKQKRA